MVDISTIGIFLLAVLALLMSPGPNMAFVLSHGVAYGPRGGFAAACGISAADLVLTFLNASGVTAVVAAWPPSFDVLRYLGALYLIWLGIQAVRSPGIVNIAQVDHSSVSRIMRMAMFNSLLNPKALLFFMVFLPQFVVASRGHVDLQLAILGCTLSIAALFFNCMLGAFSGQIGEFLKQSPRTAKYQRWVLGGILLSLALRLLLLDRPVSR